MPLPFFTKPVFTLFAACLITLNLNAQLSKADSLFSKLKLQKKDTSRVIALNALAWELMYQNPDTSILLSNEALEISKNINHPKGYKKGIANSLRLLGWFQNLKGEYGPAYEKYKQSLTLFRELGDQPAISSVLGYIGVAHKDMGDYSKALDYYLQALKIAEDVGDKKKAAVHMANIGVVYFFEGQYDKALEWDLKVLKMFEEQGNKGLISTMLGSIGTVYQEKQQFDKALDYHFKALAIDSEINNKNGLARTFGNVGLIHFARGDNSKALKYFSDALKIEEEIGDRREVATQYHNIGRVYTKTGNYKEAEKVMLLGLDITKETGAAQLELDTKASLSDLYERMGNTPKAFYYFKQATALRDTLFSQEKDKEMTRKAMNYEFEKKEAIYKEQQENARILAKEKDTRFKIVIASILVGFILVVIFTIYIVRSLRLARKQKHLIEEKQREILDSIRYAKRIQMALLTAESYIGRSINKLKTDKEI